MLTITDLTNQQTQDILSEAARQCIPEQYPVSDDISFVWSTENDTFSGKSTDDKLHIKILLSDDNSIDGFTFTWIQDDNTETSEDAFLSPIQAMNILNQFDVDTPEQKQSDWKSYKNLLDAVWGNDDAEDINLVPFTVNEFIDIASELLPRCEATVYNYIKENKATFINIYSNSVVDAVFLEDNCVYAHKFDGTKIPFEQLTIGQFMSITDELLYRTTQSEE